MLSFMEFTFLIEASAKEVLSKYPHLNNLNLSPKHLIKYGMSLGKMKDLPDAEKVNQTLQHFDTHGSKLEGKLKDFNQHPSFEHVQTALRPHVERSETKKTETKQAKSESPVVYDNGKGLTVRHITTPEAAQGPHCAGTKWCVTSRGKTGKDFFKQYAGKGKVKNKMYTIHTSDGRKYAYHEGDHEHEGDDEGEDPIARDEADDVVPLHKLVREHPDLQKSEHLQNSKWGAFFGNREKQKEMINHSDHKVRAQIAKHPEHAEKLINDLHPEVRTQVAKHPEHAEKLINDLHPEVRRQVAKHPEHAGKLVDDTDSSVREEVAKHPEHAEKLIKDKSPNVRRQVAKHPEHAGKLVNDRSSSVREEVAKHPEHADKLVNDKDAYVRRVVAKHPEHADKLVNDSDFGVREIVATHPEHAGKLVNDPNSDVRAQVAAHPEHAGKLVNDSDKYVSRIAKKTLSKNKS